MKITVSFVKGESLKPKKLKKDQDIKQQLFLSNVVAAIEARRKLLDPKKFKRPKSLS